MAGGGVSPFSRYSGGTPSWVFRPRLPSPLSLSLCPPFLMWRLLSCPHRHTFPTSGRFQLIHVRLKVTRDQRVRLGGELRLLVPACWLVRHVCMRVHLCVHACARVCVHLCVQCESAHVHACMQCAVCACLCVYTCPYTCMHARMCTACLCALV